MSIAPDLKGQRILLRKSHQKELMIGSDAAGLLDMCGCVVVIQLTTV